jgi:hypothetical protein
MRGANVLLNIHNCYVHRPNVTIRRVISEEPVLFDIIVIHFIIIVMNNIRKYSRIFKSNSLRVIIQLILYCKLLNLVTDKLIQTVIVNKFQDETVMAIYSSSERSG